MTSVLDQIGIKHNCDKSSLHHGYCDLYSRYINDIPAGFRILEIGYGGYANIDAGGESARMWKEWAPGIDLTIVDLFPKNNIPEGVTFIDGSQTDPATYESQDSWDVIIDDGSHLNADIIRTFQLLWPKLKSQGLYCVEDTHSSYDPYYPDSSPIPTNPVPTSKCGPSEETAMQFFARLSHQVNKAFFNELYHEPYGIEYIHFYKDLVIIKKA